MVTSSLLPYPLPAPAYLVLLRPAVPRPSAAMPVLAAPLAATSQAPVFWLALSRLIGWTYTLAWTASFWPQALLIWKRKSVSGISLDFLSLNLFGFFCYSIFNVAFLVSPLIQQQYRKAHDGQENLVRWNDAAFALHAFLMALWQLASAFYFPRAPGQGVSRWSKALLGVLLSIFVVTLVACIVGGGGKGSSVRWLDFVNICSYIKLIITLVKYAVSPCAAWPLDGRAGLTDVVLQPQILLNRSRKSTLGFAIHGITLDMTGGLLSLLQLVIDAQIINHDWSGVTGDPGKLGLAFISLFFDVVLMGEWHMRDLVRRRAEAASTSATLCPLRRRPRLGRGCWRGRWRGRAAASSRMTRASVRPSEIFTFSARLSSAALLTTTTAACRDEDQGAVPLHGHACSVQGWRCTHCVPQPRPHPASLFQAA